MTTPDPTVTAVIVTYNSRDEIGAALNALLLAEEAGYARCVVVDNASSDGTADLVAARYPWVTLVRSTRNLGYGRGCNLGFEQVTTPYMLILNPDAVVDQPTLQTLVDFMEEHQQAGIAAPAIIHGGNELQQTNMLTTPKKLLAKAWGLNDLADDPDRPEQPIVPGSPPFHTSWVCGAIMLIRTDLFRQLGGFDPRFFLYFEETDLCLRTTQQGHEIWAVGEAVARHVGAASTAKTGHDLESSCIAEHYYRSRYYYLVKHFGWLRATGTEILVRLAQELRYLREILAGRGAEARQNRIKRPFLRFPIHPGDQS